jgi:hypothetical protein
MEKQHCGAILAATIGLLVAQQRNDDQIKKTALEMLQKALDELKETLA